MTLKGLRRYSKITFKRFWHKWYGEANAIWLGAPYAFIGFSLVTPASRFMVSFDSCLNCLFSSLMKLFNFLFYKDSSAQPFLCFVGNISFLVVYCKVSTFFYLTHIGIIFIFCQSLGGKFVNSPCQVFHILFRGDGARFSINLSSISSHRTVLHNLGKAFHLIHVNFVTVFDLLNCVFAIFDCVGDESPPAVLIPAVAE